MFLSSKIYFNTTKNPKINQKSLLIISISTSGVIEGNIFPILLVVGVLKPLAVQQIEPLLCRLLFLPAIFS